MIVERSFLSNYRISFSLSPVVSRFRDGCFKEVIETGTETEQNQDPRDDCVLHGYLLGNFFGRWLFFSVLTFQTSYQRHRVLRCVSALAPNGRAGIQ